MYEGFVNIGFPQLGAPRMATLNVFQPPLIRPDGKFHPLEPLSEPGDYLEMTAEMAVIWALSCCPYPGPNGFWAYGRRGSNLGSLRVASLAK